MKSKKLAAVMRGIAAITACVLVLSSVGTGIANGWRTALDGFLGTNSFVTISDEEAARSEKECVTVEGTAGAARGHGCRSPQHRHP